MESLEKDYDVDESTFAATQISQRDIVFRIRGYTCYGERTDDNPGEVYSICLQANGLLDEIAPRGNSNAVPTQFESHKVAIVRAAGDYSIFAWNENAAIFPKADLPLIEEVVKSQFNNWIRSGRTNASSN